MNSAPIIDTSKPYIPTPKELEKDLYIPKVDELVAFIVDAIKSHYKSEFNYGRSFSIVLPRVEDDHIINKAIRRFNERGWRIAYTPLTGVGGERLGHEFTIKSL